MTASTYCRRQAVSFGHEHLECAAHNGHASRLYRMPIDHYFRGDQLATAADKDVVRVNNDTLYLLAWLDLRTEPRVIEAPPVPDNRYFVVQLVDMFCILPVDRVRGQRQSARRFQAQLHANVSLFGWQSDARPGLRQRRLTHDSDLRENTGRPKRAELAAAPNGPFTLTTRLYMPKPEALDPLYAPPPVEVVK